MHIMTPSEFVRALADGLIHYAKDQPGVSFNGKFIGEFSPLYSGRRVVIARTGDGDAVAA